MATSTEPRRITIFDTTLRDGEQSPGCSMNLSEKLEVAHALVDLGVDVIEAGFPITSVGDFEAVQQIAQSISDSTICGLARCRDQDIDRAWEALKSGENTRIHVFLATSAIHREFKLRMDKEEIIRRAVAGVTRARNCCDNIEFSPEDAARTEIDFLCQVVEAAIEAGATTVNIPDTVGYATPAHFASVIHNLVNRVPNIDQAVISVHCHNDLGLAVANSLCGRGDMERDKSSAQSTALANEPEIAPWKKWPWHFVPEATTTVQIRESTRPGLVPTSPTRLEHHGNGSATQQGHRGSKRICP